MQFNVALKTDIGRRRQKNQDSSGVYPELGLFVVSDGMGGHKGGEIASATAVQVIHQIVQAQIAHASPSSHTALDEILLDAIETANDTIYETSHMDLTLQGMGTTTTALLIQDNLLTIGQVGDSRCYFIRPSAIWQLTRDHSLVQEKVRAGILTREQARSDRLKNVITRSVGFEPIVNVELFHMMIQPGDCFLICSDGLSGLVPESETLEIITHELFNNNDIHKTVEKLVETANTNGGDDNITAILLQVV